MKNAAALGHDKRRLHVVAAQPVFEHQRLVEEEDEDGDEPAGRASETPADPEDVEKRGGATERVPETEAEFVVREAGLDAGSNDPEFQRRFFEERPIGEGAAGGNQPLT